MMFKIYKLVFSIPCGNIFESKPLISHLANIYTNKNKYVVLKTKRYI